MGFPPYGLPADVFTTRQTDFKPFFNQDVGFSLIIPPGPNQSYTVTRTVNIPGGSGGGPVYVAPFLQTADYTNGDPAPIFSSCVLSFSAGGQPIIGFPVSFTTPFSGDPGKALYPLGLPGSGPTITTPVGGSQAALNFIQFGSGQGNDSEPYNEDETALFYINTLGQVGAYTMTPTWGYWKTQMKAFNFQFDQVQFIMTFVVSVSHAQAIYSGLVALQK